ncbi:PREDICTED: SET and MYND domain-containing protein 4 isoform X2 [Tarenaya hassleriana]|uniref:SET and MYND domain-containing protein 4 isoform X2 n=1 Tax=Tarenaya hassleriana TaxID=28532 RepID=UPI00053C777B|nr:PREDICTED: SET and MYND domain-containing protein 4 isoform X2 [Tarenaya hassleriana]
MEKLKSLIPEDLRETVRRSTANDLHSSSSSLLRLFLGLPQFHHAVNDLADSDSGCCGKDKDAALDLKRRGNHCFRSRKFHEALLFYSKALRLAPPDAIDGHRNLLASLFLNRANVLHNLDLLAESLRDCHRALRIDPFYAKAWYRRGKLNTVLGNYEEAFRDFTVSLSLESSVDGKKQLQDECKIISDQRNKQASGHTAYRVSDSASSDYLLSVPSEIKLRCVSTEEKGRGMVSECDIQQSTVVHVEEPYSVVILKSCRETHCHFCLNELPADSVPCSSCSVTVYCSELCQFQSGGMVSRDDMDGHHVCQSLPDDLSDHIKGVTSVNNLFSGTECIREHQHECLGANWPAVLPSDVVLAGRILVKLINQGKLAMDLSNLQENLDLSHSYSEMDPESKINFHIFSTVLLFCLNKSFCSDLSINGISVTQTIILLSQIKVNSIAVVCMRSAGLSFKSNPSENIPGKGQIQSLEQIRVGQALYKTGSLFNHSCKPNIHAYFLSRRLILRTTEFVPTGCPLELSYGPEVGMWDCKDRIKFLQDEYFFRCQCRGCSWINISDIVINGYRCKDPNCTGVVLDSYVPGCEAKELKHFSSASDIQIEPGICLKCGFRCDLETSRMEVKRAWSYMRRLEELTDAEGANVSALSDYLRSLKVLRSFLHMYNKGIAEAEDKVAQACYLAGDLEGARKHCEASIKILERLYEEDDHIVIGNELVKLSSIQVALGDSSGASESRERVCRIFGKYYGSHSHILFSYLKQEAPKAVV